MVNHGKKNEMRCGLVGGLLALSLTAGCAAQEEAPDTGSLATEGAEAKSVGVEGAEAKSVGAEGATTRRAAPGHKAAREVKALLRRWPSRDHAVSGRGAEPSAAPVESGDDQ